MTRGCNRALPHEAAFSATHAPGPRLVPRLLWSSLERDMNSETTTVVNVVKRQRAFIRTLNDEAARYSHSDARGAALREQIREEKARLSMLLIKPTAP